MHDAGGANAVFEHAVEGVAVGYVDGAPAIFVAVGFEGFNGTGKKKGGMLVLQQGKVKILEAKGIGLPSDEIITSDAPPVVAVQI